MNYIIDMFLKWLHIMNKDCNDTFSDIYFFIRR